jgi:hypothetical protein
MAITIQSQTIQADGLSQTVVTEVEQDLSAGGHYVREFRFFGAPEGNNPQGPLLLTVRVTSPEADALRIKTPVLSI